MCDLGIGAAIAIGAASAGVNQKAQADAASEQNKYRAQLGISQNERYKLNAESVIKDVGLQIDQLGKRQIEQAAATRQELENYARNARQAGATVRAQTAAAGIEGRTVDILHAEFERDIAEFESATARGMKSFRAQSSLEAQAIYARGQSAINQGYPNPLPPVATVNPLTNVMNGITTGLLAYSALQSFKTPNLGSPGVGAAANPNTVGPIGPTPNPMTAGATPYYLSRPITPLF